VPKFKENQSSQLVYTCDSENQTFSELGVHPIDWHSQRAQEWGEWGS